MPGDVIEAGDQRRQARDAQYPRIGKRLANRIIGGKVVSRRWVALNHSE
jgi:hypothetical protein